MAARYCLFGYYGQGNMGDEAILASMVRGLSSAGIQLTVYSSHPVMVSRMHQVDSCKLFPLTLVRLAKSLLKRNRVSILRAIWCFIRADVIVIGGGGLFFDTPETNKWMKGYVSLVALAKRLGKRVAIVGVSVGPLHHWGSRGDLRRAFEQSSLVTVRDEPSRALLIDCGVEQSKIRVVPDFVFALPTCEHVRAVEILKAETGFTTSDLVVLAPCVYNIEVEGWIDSYRALIAELVSTFKLSVVLVPMQRTGRNDDLYAIERIVEKMDKSVLASVGWITGAYSPIEIQGVFSLASFVFSERLHGTIMAANTGRPFMSLAYMPKVAGVLDMLGNPTSGVSMDAFCRQDYFQALSEALLGSIKEPGKNNRAYACQEEAKRNLGYLIDLEAR